MELLTLAKTLRENQTDAEQRLWYHLRAHRFMNLKFKRQKPVGRYIVDFICHESSLIVEVDGGQHQDNSSYDECRDAWLREQGYTVLRFWNHEVMLELESVLEAIRLAMLHSLPQAGEGSKTRNGNAQACYQSDFLVRRYYDRDPFFSPLPLAGEGPGEREHTDESIPWPPINSSPPTPNSSASPTSASCAAPPIRKNWPRAPRC